MMMRRLETIGPNVNCDPDTSLRRAEEDGDVWTHRLDTGQVEVHRTVSEYDCLRLTREPRLEDGPQVGQIVRMGIALHDFIPKLGMENVLQCEGHLVDPFRAVRFLNAFKPPAIAEWIGYVRNWPRGCLRGRDSTHQRIPLFSRPGLRLAATQIVAWGRVL